MPNAMLFPPRVWKFTFKICFCQIPDSMKSMGLLCWRAGCKPVTCSHSSFWYKPNHKNQRALWTDTYLTKVDCDWPPVFSKFGVLGLCLWGRHGLWQWIICRGHTAVLRDVLGEEGRFRVALGSWPSALLPHPYKPRGLLITAPGCSKPGPRGEAEETEANLAFWHWCTKEAKTIHMKL